MIISRKLQQELLLFLASGALAACVNFFSRKLLSVYLPLGYAVSIAYFFGMITAFFLFRKHVFTQNNDPLITQATRFFIVNIIAMLQTLLITLLFASHLINPFKVNILGYPFTHEDIAHGIGICIPTVSSFLGHKFYSFRKNNQR